MLLKPFNFLDSFLLYCVIQFGVFAVDDSENSLLPLISEINRKVNTSETTANESSILGDLNTVTNSDLFTPFPNHSSFTKQTSSSNFTTSTVSSFVTKTQCFGEKNLKQGNCEKEKKCIESSGLVDGKGVCLSDEICCLEVENCNSLVESNGNIIENVQYPNSLTKAGHCVTSINKLPNVVTIKVEFRVLQLAPPDPKTSICAKDAIWFEGLNDNFPSKKFCGNNNKAHIYLPVDDKQESLIIHFNLSEEGFKRRWQLSITQLERGSIDTPPQGCVQYFTNTSGLLTNFNFEELRNFENIDSLNKSICIPNEAGFCRILFESKSDNRVFSKRVNEIVHRSINVDRYRSKDKKRQAYDTSYKFITPIVNIEPLYYPIRPSSRFPINSVMPYAPSLNTGSLQNSTKEPSLDDIEIKPGIVNPLKEKDKLLQEIKSSYQIFICTPNIHLFVKKSNAF